MNINLESFIEHPITTAIGWMLFHSVWQAAIVGIVIACLLALLNRSSAQLRYLIACAGLAIMVIAPVATMLILPPAAGSVQVRAQSLQRASPLGPSDFTRSLPSEDELSIVPKNSQAEEISYLEVSNLKTPFLAGSRTESGLVSSISTLAPKLQKWLPVFVGLWAIGVCLLAIRLLAGLQRIRLWRAAANVQKSDEIKSLVDNLSKRMGVRQNVPILETLKATVPAVMGWLRPTILIPTSMISGLTTKELEMILAHELAHVRRYDYLANLMQTTVETVLFYHPVVWWLSHRIRVERENCCDDIAIAVCGNRVEFAQALARLEQLRCENSPRFSVAATGGSLVKRIRRILAKDTSRSGVWWPAGLIVLGSLALLVCGVYFSEAMASSPARDLNLENSMLIDEDQKMNDEQDGESQQKKAQPLGTISVESSGALSIDPRSIRPNMKVLATHTYNSRRRESTGWIKLRGANVPIDKGVSHGDVTVFVTLMHDVAAIDSKNKNLLWEQDWGKTTPMWQTVSIVELPGENQNSLAVELFAPKGRDGKPAFKYMGLLTGETIEYHETADEDGQHHEHDEVVFPKILVAEKDDQRITRAYTNASKSGRSPGEMFKQVLLALQASGNGEAKGNITNMESIVSAYPRYLLNDFMDADKVLFNLPESSGLRAEFSGESIEIRESKDKLTVVVTNGKLELLDAGGVVRAKASADGGAELLVVDCRIENSETVMEMTTAWLNNSEEELPPVQVKMNTNTGAPVDETDPPHGAVRYSIFPEDKTDKKPARMKMEWHYNVQRLAKEAERELTESPKRSKPPLPTRPRMQTNAPSGQDLAALPEEEWGPKPDKGNLRLRLLVDDKQPKEGLPVTMKLEIKNFGDQPQKFDPQHYEPFRVLKVINAKGESDLFIGMTPQTSGGDVEIAPGQTMTIWKNEDAGKLYMLGKGDYKINVAAPKFGGAELPGSQTVSIEIQEGKQPALKRLIGNLHDNLPEGWEVSNGWGAIYLTHSPTNLKRDATSIQIWFTKDKLPVDSKLGDGDTEQTVSYIGHSELGHINVAAPTRATRLWPEHINLIGKVWTLTFGQQKQTAAPIRRPEPMPRAIKAPWIATGQVTDRDNNLIPGVQVKAHCGAGSVNWKTAIKEAGDSDLELKWDGLSTDKMIRAGFARLNWGIDSVSATGQLN